MYILYKGAYTGNLMLWKRDTTDPGICWFDRFLVCNEPREYNRRATANLYDSEGFLGESEDLEELYAIAIMENFAPSTRL